MGVLEMPVRGISTAKSVAFVSLSLVGLVLFPSIETGLIALGFWLFLWGRTVGWREAVVGAFVLSCVLASSREEGLQYWKEVRLGMAGMVVLEALRIMREQSTTFRRRQIGWVLVIFLCTGFPALLSEEARAGFLETILLGGMWFSMMVVGTSELSEERQRVRVRFLFLLAWSIGIASALVTLASTEVGFLHERWRGIFGNPNEFSHWWIFVTLLAISYYANRWREASRWILAGLAILALTGSRGALVSTILAVLAFALKWFGQGRKAFWLPIALTAIPLAVTQFWWLPPLVESLPISMTREQTVNAETGRLLAWKYAVEEINKEPWFGQGGGYDERYFKENYRFFSDKNHQGLSHNSWLAFSMNYGILGGISLILVLMSRLQLFRPTIGILVWPAIFFSLTVEGWLTAPLNALSPMLFFVGGLIGQLNPLPTIDHIDESSAR